MSKLRLGQHHHNYLIEQGDSYTHVLDIRSRKPKCLCSAVCGSSSPSRTQLPLQTLWQSRQGHTAIRKCSHALVLPFTKHSSMQGSSQIPSTKEFHQHWRNWTSGANWLVPMRFFFLSFFSCKWKKEKREPVFGTHTHTPTHTQPYILALRRKWSMEMCLICSEM